MESGIRLWRGHALLLRPNGDAQLEGAIVAAARGCGWRCGCACPTVPGLTSLYVTTYSGRVCRGSYMANSCVRAHATLFLSLARTL
jgi:hypothetical protein